MIAPHNAAKIAQDIADDARMQIEMALERVTERLIDPDEVDAAEFVSALLRGDRALAVAFAPRLFNGATLHRVEVLLARGDA